jgi:hypothetical protein
MDAPAAKVLSRTPAGDDEDDDHRDERCAE